MIKDPNCKNKRWHVEELEKIVFDEIRKLALDPEYINKIKEDQPEDQRPSVINGEISKIEKKISKLMDLYTTDLMPVDVLQEKIHALDDKKKKLEYELIVIAQEKKKKLSHEETVKLVQSFGEILDRNDLDEIRAVIGTLINRVEINDEDIKIHWNFI